MWPPKEPTKHQPFGGVTGQPLADFKEIRSGEAIPAKALVAIHSDGLIYQASTTKTNALGVAVEAAPSGGLVHIRPIGYIRGVTANAAISIGNKLTYAATAGRVTVFSSTIAAGTSGTPSATTTVAADAHTHTGPSHSHSVNGSPTSTASPASSGHGHSILSDSGTHDHGGTTGPASATTTVASSTHGHGSTSSAGSGSTGANNTNVAVGSDVHTHSIPSIDLKTGQCVGIALTSTSGAGETLDMLVWIG